MFGRVVSAILLCGAFVLLVTDAASAASKTINKPMFNGNRLDWCLKWSADCGKPAADAFCKAQGYQTAVKFEPERRIGSQTPTRLIGTGATCDLPYCDGFRLITCETTPIAKPVTAKKQEAPLPLVRASYIPPLPQAKPARVAENAAPAATVVKPVEAKTADAGVVKEIAKAEPKAVVKVEPKAVAKAEAKIESPKPDPVPTGSVRATTPLPALALAPKLFDKPMYNGKRLDWCHAWDKDCGQIAADAFCKTNGFSRAKGFEQDPHIGDAQPTRVIANGAVCDQAVCNGFKAITCTM
jgi:hypothetical protein